MIFRLLSALSLAIVLIGVSYTPAMAGGAVLYLSPGSATVKAGSTLAVYIRVNSGSEPVNAVQANLTYPADRLEFKSISSAGSAFDISAEASGGGGSVRIARGSVNPVTGDKLVATVYFRVLASSGSGSIMFAGGSDVIRSTDNVSILAGKTGGTYYFQPVSTGGGSIKRPTPLPGAPVPSGPSEPAPPPPPRDTAAPKVSNIRFTNVSPTGASIEWETDEPANSFAQYGLTDRYGLEVSDRTMKRQHKLSFSPDFMIPRTRYYVRIKSSDASGNAVTSQKLTFITAGYEVVASIVNQDNNPLKGALVTIGDQSGKTDASGKAVFKNIAPGKRMLSVTYRGQETSDIINVGPNKEGKIEPVQARLQMVVPVASLINQKLMLPGLALVAIGLLWGELIGRTLARVPKLAVEHAARSRRKLALAEREHSGRLLPHHHTSYAAIFFMMILTAVIMSSVTLSTRADNGGEVGVQASVTGPVPYIPAKITTPAGGSKISRLPLKVEGTCQPGVIVKIHTSDTVRGTTICEKNGRFNVSVGLAPGVNVLTARSYNLADQEGSRINDGTMVTYEPEFVLSYDGSYQIPDALPILVLRSDKTVAGAWKDKPFQWSAHVSGGLAPYALEFEWGDGTSDLVSQPQSGAAAVMHTYEAEGNFPLRIKATDAAGQQAFMQVMVLSHASGPAKGGIIPKGTLRIAWPLYGVALLMLLSFWLGERAQKRKDEDEGIIKAMSPKIESGR